MSTSLAAYGVMKRKHCIGFGAIPWGIFQVYSSIVGPFDATLQRATHLAFALFLAFMIFPFSKHLSGTERVPLLDMVLGILAAIASLYLASIYDVINTRVLFVDAVTPLQLIFGVLLILILLEATRRVAGWPLVILSLVFILYCLTSYLLPGILHSNRISILKLVEHQYLSTGGIFGTPLAVSATYAYLFVLFGSFLEVTGVGKYLIDCALSLTGSLTGGPAKVAVISSGLMGSLSGSAVANVVTTGTFTIPLMKRFGYPAHFAAATEAVASSGGVLMPPVMGVVAFIMAEYTGISYWKIVIAGIIPATLYYLGVFLMVHYEARRNNLYGLPRKELPRIGELFKTPYLLLPLFVLVYFLGTGHTPLKSGLYALLATLLVTPFSPVLLGAIKARDFRTVLQKCTELLFGGLINSASAAVTVGITTAAAGIVVGVNSLTGIGLRLSTNLLNMFGGSILLLLIVLAFISILLGMGMPSSASYITVATVLVPGLIWAGLPLLEAHMFAFYTTSAAAITPPVALAVFAAAPIAGASIWKTGWTALKLGISMLIIPFIFVYEPALLAQGSVFQVLWETSFAVVSVLMFSSAVMNRFVGEMLLITRILASVAAVLTILPGQLALNVTGLTFAVVVGVINWQRTVRTGGQAADYHRL